MVRNSDPATKTLLVICFSCWVHPANQHASGGLLSCLFVLLAATVTTCPRSIPTSHNQNMAFSQWRQQYGFTSM